MATVQHVSSKRVVRGEEAPATEVERIAFSAHRDTTRMPPAELVSNLNKCLGATLVAALSGSRNSKAPYRWASGQVVPSAAADARLRAAHRVWMMLEAHEGEHVARTWFVGANPLLGEQQPVMALREGREVDVLAAATAFIDGVWHG